MQRIKRIPIVQQVEGSIRTLIEQKDYQAGEKLPTEMELCQQLGVGRGTVREAFCLLQAKGLVEIKPGRGAFVSISPPNNDINAIDWLVQNEMELRDSIEIRVALEPMAARHMAERCTADQLEQLCGIHGEFLNAIEYGDASNIARLDELFHSAIVEGSNNRLLMEINTQVCQGMQTFRNKTFQVQQNVRNAVTPHSNIFHAISLRDGNRAEMEMRLHLEKVREDLSTNIYTDDTIK